jgi:hypothetical protein
MTRTGSDVRLRRAARLARAVVGAVAAIVAPAAASGQAVVLRLEPRVGDTLHGRLDRQVEMAGPMRVAADDSTETVATTLPSPTQTGDSERDSARGGRLRTTDSVAVSSSGGDATRHAANADRARSALEGQRVRLRVASDGATEIVAAAGASPAAQAVLSQMPATLPRERVAVGEHWTRTMRMPGPPGASAAARGQVTTTYRLDSLGRDGSLAYVSLRGTVTRPDGDAPSSGAARMAGEGTLAGTLVVDRRRGWLAAAHTILTVRSTLRPPPNSAAQPMRFRMRIEEWLRAVDR